MASGDTVLSVHAVMPLTASGATMGTLAGGTTQVERYRVAEFSGSGSDTNYLDLLVYLDQAYAGGGLTVKIPWCTASTTTGNNVVLQAALRRFQEGTEQLTASHSYAFNTVTSAVPSASAHVITHSEITFTDGADMDSLAAGEWAILRLLRDAAHASDTESGNAAKVLYQGVVGEET